MKLKFGDIIGLLNHINLFNVTSRGVDKRLDALEQTLSGAFGGEDKLVEEDSDLDEEDVRQFSELEFDLLLEGVSIQRGSRKRLEYLLVKKG